MSQGGSTCKRAGLQVLGFRVWGLGPSLYPLYGVSQKLGVPTIMENQMKRKWKMKWKLGLYRGLLGLGFPKIGVLFWGSQ